MSEAYEAALQALEKKLVDHERTCAVRYRRIEENQKTSRTDRARMHGENTKALAVMGGRIDRLYHRAWLVAIAIISGLLAAVGVLLKIIWELMPAGLQP